MATITNVPQSFERSKSAVSRSWNWPPFCPFVAVSINSKSKSSKLSIRSKRSLRLAHLLSQAITAPS